MSDSFATPWTVARQAPPSLGFSRQEYWSGLPFPSPGGLPGSRIKLVSPGLAGRFFTTKPPGKPLRHTRKLQNTADNCRAHSRPFISAQRSLQQSWPCFCYSGTRLCPVLCDTANWSTPGLPVHHQLPEITQMLITSVIPSNHLILCRTLLLLPSILPNIRVFSNELVLRIRWPKY